MIGTSKRSHLERHEPAVQRSTAPAGTFGCILPSAPVAGPTFASELATANDGSPPQNASADGPWSKALELARSGGTARITISTASGEPVELRVTVRGGRVTVLAHVTSRAAETAIRGIQDTIARSLNEAGLSLHQFHVRQPGPNQAHLRDHLRRQATRPSRRERDREEKS